MNLERSKRVHSPEGLEIEDLKNQIERILFEIIDETNDRLPEDQQIGKEKSTQLYGEGAALDSMELVNFVVALEEKIQRDLNVAINLESEEAVSPEEDPFRSIESLTAHAIMLIKEKIHG